MLGFVKSESLIGNNETAFPLDDNSICIVAAVPTRTTFHWRHFGGALLYWQREHVQGH